MPSLLLALVLAACDSDSGKTEKPAAEAASTEKAAVDAPPDAVAGVRHGDAFIRCCWFATFTDEQRTALESAASAAVPKETAARTAVATAILDATQALADGKSAEELAAAADAIAQAERAEAETELATLDALVAVLGPEQLDAGGAEAATKALSSTLQSNPWLMENNPFDRPPRAITDDTAIGAMVPHKLAVSRSFLTFQAASTAAMAELATLDLSAPEWKDAFPAARKTVLDAWQAHRLTTITAYLTWSAALDATSKQRLILENGVQAGLNLPSQESPPTDAGGGQGMGPGGQGMGPGGQGMGPGGQGMGPGGQGMGPGGQGMGPGGPGMGPGGQGMGPGGQGMGPGGQGMGPGGQGMGPGGQGMGPGGGQPGGGGGQPPSGGGQ